MPTHEEDVAYYHALLLELDAVVVEHNKLSLGKTGKELLEIKRAQNHKLQYVLQQQARALALRAGESIEPQVISGEAVLLPVFGVGGLVE